MLLSDRVSIVKRARLIAVGAVVLAPFLVFYFPYLAVFVETTSSITYFGIPARDYHTGAFTALPEWLNLGLSWIALGLAKLSYLVGLRPSDAGTDLVFVLFRALPGIVLLIGLYRVAVSRDRPLQLLVGLFLFPIFLGAAQDRYILPLQPVLFYFGLQTLEQIRCAFRGRGRSRKGVM
jgi:hypothetical protein